MNFPMRWKFRRKVDRDFQGMKEIEWIKMNHSKLIYNFFLHTSRNKKSLHFKLAHQFVTMKVHQHTGGMQIEYGDMM